MPSTPPIAGNWLPEVLQQISTLARMPENWDGYGSPPLRPSALLTAESLLSGIPLADVPAPVTAPVTGGGLGLTWMLESRRLEIEILPDGSLEYFTVERTVDEERVTESALPRERLGEAAQLMRRLTGWLLRG